MWKSFRVRILIAMLAAALASTGLLFAVSYQNAVETLERNFLRTNAKNAGAQIARFDEYMSDLYQGAVRASTDSTLKNAVADYLALEHPRTDDVLALSTLLAKFCDSADAIETVYLYLPDRQEMLTSNTLHPRRTHIAPEAYPWTQAPAGFAPVRFSDMMSGSPRWVCGYGKPVVASSGNPVAVICAGMAEQTLRYALADSTDYDNFRYLLNGTEAVPVRADQPDLSALLPDAVELIGNTEMVSGAFGEWLYAGAQADFSGVRLLWLTARGGLRDELASLQTQFFVLLLMAVLLAAILSELLVRWLYRPIGTLIDAMGRVGGGDFSPCPEPEQPEEFRQLSHSFNEMIDEINGLIDDLVAERTAKAEAELKALQYQIQPHFMYNTLNSIKFAAVLQGNPKIAEQLGAFIALLEASISKKGTLVTLSDEAQLLENYVSLQRYRYMDCFTVEYDFAEEARACYVPRLLLQPIVENAILHGMDVKRNDNYIRVAALVTDGSLWIMVQDNGAGMTPEQLEALLSAEKGDHRQFTGIGVMNIRERLRLYYGSLAEVKVYSKPGEGTKFVLTLPASYNEGEYSR